MFSDDNFSLSRDCAHELARDSFFVLVQISGRNNSSLSAPIPKKQLFGYNNNNLIWNFFNQVENIYQVIPIGNV